VIFEASGPQIEKEDETTEDDETSNGQSLNPFPFLHNIYPVKKPRHLPRWIVNPVRKSSTFQRKGSHGALNSMFAPKGILSSSPLQAAGLSNGVKGNFFSIFSIRITTGEETDFLVTHDAWRGYKE
jgi:hypothetical protein